VAFNAPSLAKFGPTVRPGGTIIYDSSVIGAMPDTLTATLAAGVRVVGVPIAEVAKELGSALVKNVVALGALQGVTQIFPKETFLAAIRTALSGKRAMVGVNEQAFERGVALSAELASR
jgi:Pyruvate/2-oxoacid:ferredoxin oxidoreductase gamma subunit